MFSQGEEKVIVTVPFNGAGLTYIEKDGKIKNSDAKSFEEFQSYHPGVTLTIVSFMEYDQLVAKHYYKRFERIKKKEYEEALKSSTLYKEIKPSFVVFFSSTVISHTYANIYLYDSARERYYKGCRSMVTTEKEIFLDILKEI